MGDECIGDGGEEGSGGERGVVVRFNSYTLLSVTWFPPLLTHTNPQRTHRNAQYSLTDGCVPESMKISQHIWVRSGKATKTHLLIQTQTQS